MTQTQPQVARPDIAFYYPGPHWQSGEWAKSLLLFFDGIALLVPSYLRDKPAQLDPELVLPMQDAGLLRIVVPEEAIDKKATEQLTHALTDVIASGVLDKLAKEPTAFRELSWSRLGGFADESLARMIHDELKKRGLARDSEDGVSIPMHPMVRSLVLVLLSQLLRPYGDTLGVDLAPTTDRPELVDALQELLNVSSAPSAGQVVTFDLAAVGVDLSTVPLDEVLGFRKQHGADYRRYASSVRRFVRDLSVIPAPERQKEFAARQEELRELASQIEKTANKFWKKAARLGFGVAGAAWSASTGNPIGAALGIGGAILAFDKSNVETGAYSYIFRAGAQYV